MLKFTGIKNVASESKGLADVGYMPTWVLFVWFDFADMRLHCYSANSVNDGLL